MKVNQWILGVALWAVSLRAADVDKVTAGAPSNEIQTIDYDGQRIPDPLDALLRYNTVIRLKSGELAREVSAGNAADLTKPGSGDWIVAIAKDGDAVYLKPTRPGTATNLEIRTDHNTRYAFFIQDRSQDKGYHPHLEYLINPTSEAILRIIREGPKYVLASKYEEAREDAERYKKERDELQAKLSQQTPAPVVKTERAEALRDVVCDYDLKHSRVTESPFHVSNICHDKEHTYIWAQGATDHFSIQDVKQGVPSIVFPEFNKDTGMYTVHHVIEKGRLQIGTGKKMKSAEFGKGAA
jgi:Conjugal transfer protein